MRRETKKGEIKGNGNNRNNPHTHGQQGGKQLGKKRKKEKKERLEMEKGNAKNKGIYGEKK